MARTQSEAVTNLAAGALSLTITPPATNVPDYARPTRGRLISLRVENRDAAVAWLNMYNAAAADVTPGTARWGPPIAIGASQVATVIPVDVPFASNLSIFVSPNADGTGTPTTGCRVDAEWRREA